MYLKPGESITITADSGVAFYKVRSETNPDKYYYTCEDACTCPVYIYRGVQCKHMQSLSYQWWPQVTFLDFLTAFREATKCNKCTKLELLLELSK